MVPEGDVRLGIRSLVRTHSSEYLIAGQVESHLFGFEEFVGSSLSVGRAPHPDAVHGRPELGLGSSERHERQPMLAAVALEFCGATQQRRETNLVFDPRVWVRIGKLDILRSNSFCGHDRLGLMRHRRFQLAATSL